MYNSKRLREGSNEEQFRNYLSSLNPTKTEKVYQKRKDKVYFINGKVYIKLVHFNDSMDALDEMRSLQKVVDAPKSPYLMAIEYNNILTVDKENIFHVIATKNAGTMVPNFKAKDDDIILAFYSLCSGLNHMHEKLGMVHRDIHKTNYVRSNETGKWTLIDFDLADDVDYYKSPNNHFYLHTGFVPEHHPAILLSTQFNTTFGDTTIASLVENRYNANIKSIWRQIDYFQLFLSLLLTLKLVDEEELPLVNYKPAGRLPKTRTKKQSLANEVCTKMISYITMTERAFRIDSNIEPPYVSVKNLLKQIDEANLHYEPANMAGKVYDGKESPFLNSYLANKRAKTKKIIKLR